MNEQTVTLFEIHQELDGPAGVITWPAAHAPQAGQYLLAYAPDQNEPLPTVLFPGWDPARSLHDKMLRLAPPLPAAWNAGQPLLVRGPFGTGFRMPGGAQRIALAAWDCSPARLMPLLLQGLGQGAAVALYSRHPAESLPTAVELLPREGLLDALQWADFLAVDLAYTQLPALRAALGLTRGQPCPCPAQALVRIAMPCGGAAECGVCAVRTQDGWKQACQDGPVFPLDLLVEESA